MFNENTYGVDADVFDTPINQAEAIQAEKDLLVPAGWVETEAPWSVKETTVQKDGEPDRRMVSLYGNVLVDGERAGFMSYRFSPDLRNKDGKPDWFYQQFLALKKVHKAVTGEEAKTVRELISFLESNPIALKVGQGLNKQTEVLENKIYAFGKVR